MAREYWSADCETDPFKHGRNPEPFIWGAYNGEDYHEFSTASEFVQFFMDKEVVIYAHNGGKFDWHYLLDWLEPQVKISVINGRLSKFPIGRAEFRDSYNLFPFPLSEYKKDTVDYDIFEVEKRNEPNNRDTIRKYLRADCLYLFDLLSGFFGVYGRKFTLPGAALSQWREISGEDPDQSTERFYQEFSPYYYGGRVECFQKGFKEEKFHVYDINSAYPFAMSHFHPWGLFYTVGKTLPKNDAEIGRCFIKLSTASTGAYPHRGSGGLEFPNDGKIRTFYITGWEYLAARDTGTLDARANVVSVRRFPDRIDFKKYVAHFYKLKADAKKAGDKGTYLFAKYLLNGLYGKWASNPERYSEYKTCLKDEVEAEHELSRCKHEPSYTAGTCAACEADLPCPKAYKFVCELRNVSVISRPLPENARRYFNVAVGASITGFVRAHLWRAIRKVGGVLYCDTDSIAVAGKNSPPLGPELGLWESEGEFTQWAIAGKKLYAFKHAVPKVKDGKNIEYKTASKGTKLSPEDIIRISQGAEILYEQEAPTFSLRRGKKADLKRKVRMT